MAIPLDHDARNKEERTRAEDRPFAHLQMTPEELALFLKDAKPFDAEAWLRDTEPASPEEEADLDDWLREREAERDRSLQHSREREKYFE
jgi:hypothetical protein